MDVKVLLMKLVVGADCRLIEIQAKFVNEFLVAFVICYMYLVFRQNQVVGYGCHLRVYLLES